MIRSVLALVSTDLRRLARDRFLVGTVVYVIGISLALRWLLPWIDATLEARTGFDLSPYRPLAASWFGAGNGALLVGIVTGFLFLEAYEEGVNSALSVAPIPRWLPFASLAGIAALTTVALVCSLVLLIGIAIPPPTALAAVALSSAPASVAIAGLVGGLCSNKIEAFALMKGVNLLLLAAVMAWFVPEPWQGLFGFSPFYWPAKTWWLALEGRAFAGTVLGGLGVQAIWLVLLVRRLASRS